jgi:hypothetical protein
MADLTTVRAKIQDALDEADTALGNQTVTQQLASKDSQIATLTAQVASLQSKIDAAKAALG